SAVEAWAGYQVVAGFCQVQDGEGGCRLSRGEQQCSDAAFKVSDAGFHCVGGRVSDSRVDRLQFLQRESRSSALGAWEDERSGLENWESSCSGCRIRGLAGVDLTGFK